MPPAARVTDVEVCPSSSGGPIISGAENVLIEGKPAARIGDRMDCAHGSTKIESGCATVLIAGSKAARIGDTTCHQGKVGSGATTVLIGDGGTGTMDAAHQNAAPFVRA